MPTMIEKSLERMAAYRAEIETKLEAMSGVEPQSSAFAEIKKHANLNDLMGASIADNVSRAAARLHALHRPLGFQQPSTPDFGKPASAVVIDGECTEIKPREDSGGTT